MRRLDGSPSFRDSELLYGPLELFDVYHRLSEDFKYFIFTHSHKFDLQPWLLEHSHSQFHIIVTILEFHSQFTCIFLILAHL